MSADIPGRLSAHEIFDEAVRNAEDELRRPSRALFASGFAGGLTMGLSAIAVGAVTAAHGGMLTAMLFYPVGFIAVIIGRAQLFTEQTLYPVLVVLKERRHGLNVARIWAVVLISNLAGAAAFAALAAKTGGLASDVQEAIAALGVTAAARPIAHVFASGIFGGWLIALVAWMVTASHRTIGQVAVIWFLTFVVGIGHFAHSIATSTEILVSVMRGGVSLPAYIAWVLAAVAGNGLGGVFIVSLLNYGQVEHTIE